MPQRIKQFSPIYQAASVFSRSCHSPTYSVSLRVAPGGVRTESVRTPGRSGHLPNCAEMAVPSKFSPCSVRIQSARIIHGKAESSGLIAYTDYTE